MTDQDHTAEPRRNAEGEGARPLDAKRAWREQNKDHVRAYNKKWNAEHPERVRELNRESARRTADKERRRRLKRERDRQYYLENAEQRRANTRAWRAARAAADPDGFREAQSAQRRLWWKNRPAAVRERAAHAARERADPAAARERGRAYYHRNAEQLNAERRAYLKAHPEKRREYQSRWREKDRKRREAGLPRPVRRRTPKAERDANRAAADAFFTQFFTATQIHKMRQGPPTPPELLTAFRRESARARAAHALAAEQEMQERLAKELPAQARTHLTSAEIAAAEEARLDAIGRAINDRLRHTDPPRRAHHNDPAAPHPMLQHPHGMGMNR